MPKTKKTETLTDEQLQTLAIALRRYGGNVFTVAQSKFGVEVGDEVFDQLRKHDAFKCEDCNRWLEIAFESLNMPDTCGTCDGDWED